MLLTTLLTFIGLTPDIKLTNLNKKFASIIKIETAHAYFQVQSYHSGCQFISSVYYVMPGLEPLNFHLAIKLYDYAKDYQKVYSTRTVFTKQSNENFRLFL